MKPHVLSSHYEPKTPLAYELRKEFHLRDAVIVDNENDNDSPEVGIALARACAGYLHRSILAMVDRNEGKKIRIGIGHGWTPMELLKQLNQMRKEGLLRRTRLDGKVIWSTLVGNLPAVFSEREASVIVNGFSEHYGGSVESFRASGLIKRSDIKTTLLKEDLELIENLSSADLIVTSGAPWTKDAILADLLNPEAVPKKLSVPKFSKKHVGTISLVFLDENGSEVEWPYSAVGLDFKGFRKAAKKGSVIVMCGGLARQEVAFAALNARLVSALVTTKKTANYLLDRKAGTASSSRRRGARRSHD
jgi:DNA-binding transcriptional regulator LsrR (DeoR family)